MRYENVEDIVLDLECNPIESSGSIYHPIPFDEFEGLKTSADFKETNKKLKYIIYYAKYLTEKKPKDLKVLDIGANAGFYTFSFGKLGSYVKAFEPHPRYKVVGEHLVRFKNLNIDWVGEPFNPDKIDSCSYDIALMLSSFQWIAEGGNKMKEACQQLRFLSDLSDCLFFELGYNKGKSCIRTNQINHYNVLINLLKDNTSYQSFKLICKTKLWKGNTRYLVLCSNNPIVNDNLFYRMVRSIPL